MPSVPICQSVWRSRVTREAADPVGTVRDDCSRTRPPLISIQRVAQMDLSPTHGQVLRRLPKSEDFASTAAEIRLGSRFGECEWERIPAHTRRSRTGATPIHHTIRQPCGMRVRGRWIEPARPASNSAASQVTIEIIRSKLAAVQAGGRCAGRILIRLTASWRRRRRPRRRAPCSRRRRRRTRRS